MRCQNRCSEEEQPHIASIKYKRTQDQLKLNTILKRHIFKMRASW